MRLESKVFDFLKSLTDESFFFVCKNQSASFVGIVRGQAVCILVTDKKSLTKSQIKFSASVYQSQGEFFCIRSIDDLCEIAKIKGWHD